MSSLQRTRSPSPAPRRLGDTMFRFEELDLQQNEIRLLQILPGFDQQQIECEVLHARLDGSSQYTALSYSWGDAEDTCGIKLNGYDFPVTRSLWGALRRLRSEKSAATIWADAICINQQSTTERSAQVQKMTSIYQSAANMAVWLGEEADGSNEALDLISDVLRNPGTIEQIIASPARKHQFKAVVELFERDYWHRLWCVQEVFNAKSITAYCGSRAMDLGSLKGFQSLMKPYSASLLKTWGDVVSSNRRIWPDVICRRGPGRMWTKKSADLSRLLLFCRRKLCSEPRDKVYGVLGLLNAQDRLFFPVDYSVSVREVFTNAIEYILGTENSLDIIRASINPTLDLNMFYLPSWVPNFASVAPIGALGSIKSKLFAASGETAPRYSFSNRRSRLHVSGIVLDRVKRCGMRVDVPAHIESNLMAIHHWRFILVGEFQYNVSKHEAFCRTLCLGQAKVPPHEWLVYTYSILARYTRECVPAMVADPHLDAFEDSTLDSSRRDDRLLLFEKHYNNTLPGRRFMISQTGLLSIGAGAAQSGDLICVLLGCSTPVILRPCKDYYTYVGDVYVDSYMHGKAIAQMNAGALQLQTFDLR